MLLAGNLFSFTLRGWTTREGVDGARLAICEIVRRISDSIPWSTDEMIGGTSPPPFCGASYETAAERRDRMRFRDRRNARMRPSHI
ncbi:hypothetical protein EVAR_98013_1 [Eumeta japonica]|uniref:Uncharacterized protein n=1 Tax=Eumeta variegata TaxID=151549 RepID=A0A4C1WLK8_EUMVA|nr:hypothetical protein EVAR_98013_1 [Eumeta japonica]